MAEQTSPATDAKPKFTPKRLRSITLPTLKFVVDAPLYVLLVGSLHEGKQRVGRSGVVKMDASGQPRKPPTLVEVVDLTTGETSQIIAATIIKTELEEAYPNAAYVGKAFSITKQKRKEGREYDPYEIFEIEVPDTLKALAADAVKKAKETASTPAASESSAHADAAPAAKAPPRK